MCLHRSRGRCMRIVPLSSLDQNDGRHQLRVGLRTELHNRRTSRTSRLARAHEARITASRSPLLGTFLGEKTG